MGMGHSYSCAAAGGTLRGNGGQRKQGVYGQTAMKGLYGRVDEHRLYFWCDLLIG